MLHIALVLSLAATATLRDPEPTCWDLEYYGFCCEAHWGELVSNCGSVVCGPLIISNPTYEIIDPAATGHPLTSWAHQITAVYCEARIGLCDHTVQPWECTFSTFIHTVRCSTWNDIEGDDTCP